MVREVEGRIRTKGIYSGVAIGSWSGIVVEFEVKEFEITSVCTVVWCRTAIVVGSSSKIEIGCGEVAWRVVCAGVNRANLET